MSKGLRFIKLSEASSPENKHKRLRHGLLVGGSGCERLIDIEGSDRAPCSGFLHWYCRPQRYWSFGECKYFCLGQ